MTFSVVARCGETGMFGVAISSSSPAVAARCSHAQAGVGAVASQNITDPTLGPMALDVMGRGMSAAEAVAEVQRRGGFMEFRQVLAVDGAGGTAVHSGQEALGLWTQAEGRDVAAGGNLLANEDVPAAMAAAFEEAEGHLGDRLMTALKAGLAAGGEAGPVHSAGIMVVDREPWPLVDLRCDWIEEGCPIAAVSAAWDVYKPQMADYVQRARDPRAAPSYGVPGDE
ncbi:DUF1028 domain-containing protein [Rhodobacteraceae bacterium D3-12]|nr:DUF1028 domain-containing protein [Rhodobacteraceae bacterium D3-12]